MWLGRRPSLLLRRGLGGLGGGAVGLVVVGVGPIGGEEGRGGGGRLRRDDALFGREGGNR